MAPQEIWCAVDRYLAMRYLGAGKRKVVVQASDLTEKFKHRGLKTHSERIEFYSNVLKSVLARRGATTPKPEPSPSK